jgi:hypothetical protein
MTADDVAEILGPADALDINFFQELREQRGTVGITYDAETLRVCDVGFSPGCDLVFDDWRVFEASDLVGALLRYDPQPLESAGFLVFLNSGIAITGYHDDDADQRAVSVFQRGRFDTALSRMRPYTRPA